MIDATDPAAPIGLRDRAMLVLGFAMMARRSELAALHISDVTFTDDGLTVLIRKSKTDKDASGAEVTIPRGSHPDTDPVRVVQAWLAALAEHGVTDGPLLRRINRWGQLQDGGMSGAAVNERVRHLAEQAGVPDAGKFTAHGLRAGGPTEAAKAGTPVAFIAEHGRWSPMSPQVHEYVRAVDRWRDNPMRGIGL
jgi:integrase